MPGKIELKRFQARDGRTILEIKEIREREDAPELVSVNHVHLFCATDNAARQIEEAIHMRGLP